MNQPRGTRYPGHKFHHSGSWVDYETWKEAVGEENIVHPLQSFSWGGPLGPQRFERGRPTECLDPQMRLELREAGLIQ